MNPQAGTLVAYLAETLAGMDFYKVPHKGAKTENSDTVWLFCVSDEALRLHFIETRQV